MIHSFDTEVAEKYGINAAVILNLIRGWIAYNKANNKNERDGHTWTYNSIKSWSTLLPYLSGKQIRRAIDDLVASGVLVKANFNENRYDQTLWYALAVEVPAICPPGQLDVPKPANDGAPEGKSLDQFDKPVDQSLLPAEPSEGDKFVDWFIGLLARTNAPQPKMTPTVRAGWIDAFDKLQRIDHKTKAQIWKACEWARNDQFWRTNFYAPTKLRERKDGVLRIDQFLDRLANPANATTQKPNGRGFSGSNLSAFEELDRQMAAGQG